MTDRLDCLICGRLWLPSGEPSCDCLTHSLSKPVGPAQHEPDPADVALFPLDEERPRARPGAPWREWGPGLEQLGVEVPVTLTRPTPSHRKPRPRNRISLAAGGAVAAVVGCTALAASFLNGGGRNEEAFQTLPPSPSLVMPDGGEEQADEPEHAPRPTPEREESADPGPDDPFAPEPPATPEQPADPEPTGPGPHDSEPETPPTEPAEPDPEPTAPEPETSPPAEPEPTDPEPTDPEPDPEPDPDGTLVEGDQGPAVVELQNRLRQLRWVYNGEAHGRYDTQTREAVARFQMAYGVTGDQPGVYGPATRTMLETHTTAP
ncbi:peptidoglycan-binding protein [Streptomyces sp. DSM 44915]|uniref:Peptidoglycan-binding protein n=1 Tax=Streptomyces chisholmiae TaxID=3075540 RepID=A0ABU2JPV2_9ACTN|nr:peptidoglycan-binding protein [Streptomyces sp. DSM 44915]MDT0266754.1 peptidoglycan-binding protein [Streptomyces sp. DSM 44915]